jgi:hypothetical protein
MGLTNVWLRTAADGMIRADQVVGIVAHSTPAIAGKPSRWLLDVVLPVTTGSGAGDNWISGPLHRTLAQTADKPTRAPEALARLLAQLDASSATGTIVAEPARPRGAVTGPSDGEPGDCPIRFQFVPFAPTEPARRSAFEHDDQYI